MSRLFNAIIHRLKADAAVGAVIGDRIYADPAPQGTTAPFVTMQTISNPGEDDLGGPVALGSTLIQFDCIGMTPDSAKAAANAINTNLLSIDSDSIGDTGVQVAVSRAYRNDRRDDTAGPSDGSDRVVHRTSLDFEFWHAETVP